ncbi:MAG: hypothetical protein J6Y02_20045 [Pseudobutyrivibrio sp.]|nr:hypothetical protein [Pseudobutyrivibrio sp.]
MFGIIVLIIASIIEIALIIKKKSIGTLFIAVCVESLLLVIYSILTYGQTFIHSDVATPILLWESIVKNRNIFPASFNYANGDIWFLSLQLFCAIPSLFIKSQSLVRMLASAQFVIVAVLGIVYASKKLFKNNSWSLIVPIIFLMITGQRSMLIYEAGYISLVLWLTLVPSLFYIVINGKTKLGIVQFILMTALVTASPLRYAAELILPLFLAYIYVEFIAEKVEFTFKSVLESMIKPAVLLAVPTVIGSILYSWLCSWHNMNVTDTSSTVFVASVGEIWQNIQSSVLNLYSCFGYFGGISLFSLEGISNLISIVLCTLVCIVVPYLQLKRLKNESKSVQYFYVFAMVHNAVLFMTCVFFGQVAVVRYLLTTVVLFIVISARYIYVYWLKEDIVGRVLAYSFIFCVIIEGGLITSGTFGWQDALAHKKELAKILEDNDLKKGYATYWNAYNNEVYTDLEVDFGAVLIESDGLSPFYWLVDDSAFTPEYEKTFLLLTPEEHDSLAFNIISTFGTPAQEIDNGEYYILVFDYDIVQNMKGVSAE